MKLQGLNIIQEKLKRQIWSLFEVVAYLFVFLDIFTNRLEFRKRAQIQRFSTVRTSGHKITHVEKLDVHPHDLKITSHGDKNALRES